MREVSARFEQNQVPTRALEAKDYLFRNSGNLCFAAAAIAVMKAIKTWTTGALKADPTTPIGKIVDTKLKSGGSSVAPLAEPLQSFSNGLFAKGQHDVGELLQELSDSKVVNLNDLRKFIAVERVVCKHDGCGGSRMCEVDNSVLPLSSPGLQPVVVPARFEEDHEFAAKCQCGEGHWETKATITWAVAPKVLHLVFDRSYADAKSKSAKRKRFFVVLPEEITMVVVGGQRFEYKLGVTVQHLGSTTQSGHIAAFLKIPHFDLDQQEQWWQVDSATMHPVAVNVQQVVASRDTVMACYIMTEELEPLTPSVTSIQHEEHEVSETSGTDRESSEEDSTEMESMSNNSTEVELLNIDSISVLSSSLPASLTALSSGAMWARDAQLHRPRVSCSMLSSHRRRVVS